MKPTERTSEMFNVEREIICVFSNYLNFEPRSLDIFDKALQHLPKMRAETMCEVLISKASNVEEKVDRILKSDPEHPIVIPFTYDELLSGDIKIKVENKFRKHFYSRDLFSFLSPLKKDTYFFGRSNLINEIINRFKSGEHTSLFGLRKSGKTSIVYAIERRLLSEGDQILSMDCELPSVHLLRWNELLEKIVNVYHKVKGSTLKIDTTGRYDEKLASDSFEQDMIRIYKSKKQSTTLFIFDEIERITPGTASSDHWKSGTDFIYLWQTLRGFYQRNPSVFCYMLVGTNPSCIESANLIGHENPIYASIPSQYVPPFSVEQVTQMVSRLGDYMGLRFDPILFSKLTEDFGGHPFLIRQVCSLISKKSTTKRPFTVDRALYNKCKKEFDIEARDYIEMMIHVLKDWYPEEYDMLRFLAQGDMDNFGLFAQSNSGYTRHLTGYGLIQSSESGYTFNLESLAELLRKQHFYERLNLTIEEKIQEISTRRVRLEKDLRSIVKNALKIVVGSKKATAQVLAAVPEHRRGALDGFGVNELLDRDSSPLFFLELINIIKREWSHLEHVFSDEKSYIVLILEYINKHGRPEAHAKSIDNDTFAQLRIYFTYMENKIIEFQS
jgi:hypothetical protein